MNMLPLFLLGVTAQAANVPGDYAAIMEAYQSGESTVHLQDSSFRMAPMTLCEL